VWEESKQAGTDEGRREDRGISCNGKGTAISVKN
jgi:hypothetical protein